MNVKIDVPEQANETESRLDQKEAWLPLSAEEKDACTNMLQSSSHSHVKILPNHHMDVEGQMTGFMFTCHQDTLAKVMPISKSAIQITAVYECVRRDGSTEGFHPDALRIVNQCATTRELLQQFVHELQTNSSQQPTFACIADSGDELMPDQAAWSCATPYKLGVYHSFGRTLNKDSREHKLYVVVSGCLTKACEEFQNLFHDCKEKESCRRVLDSEEIHWLRAATHRNHNRIAFDLASRLGLCVKSVLDVHDPRSAVYMALPTCYSYQSDVCIDSKSQQVRIVQGGTFLHKTDTAVILDMFATEGFWIFCGPRDLSSGAEFGTQFAYNAKAPCFSTTTVTYNTRYPVKNRRVSVYVAPSLDQNSMVSSERQGTHFAFPDEAAFACFGRLGFNRNDGMVHIMPLLCHEEVQ